MMNKKYKLLSAACEYSKVRISADKVSLSNYISTENMVPNRGGVALAESVPDAKTFLAYIPGNIPLSNIRPYFKKIWFADRKGGCSNDVLVLNVKKNTNARFLYYVLSDNNFFNYSTVTSKGTKMPRGSKHAIMKYLVPDMDLPTQQRIADILSTYDDLIENNNKRIALLEKAAQELYKEWFVRFRFPGHETTRFVNGLPEGWNRVKLSELIEFNPTIKNTGSTRYKIIPMVALSTSNMIIDETQIGISENLTGCRFNNGDTLLARITPCLENGKTGFVQCLDDFEVAGGSTEFIVMRSKKLNPYIVYFIARDQAFRDCAIASMNGADGRQRVKPDRLKKLQWLHPPMYIVDAFGEIVRPSFKLIRKLSLQNQNLAKQRDLLLPRLMSGKLEV